MKFAAQVSLLTVRTSYTKCARLHTSVRMATNAERILSELGLSRDNDGCFIGGKWRASGAVITSTNPSTNEVIANVRQGTVQDYHDAVAAAKSAWSHWAATPAPARGEVVRQIGEKLRQYLKPLGNLVFFIH